MVITLGGVVLDERLLLRGLFDSPQSVIISKRLLSGVVSVSFKPISGRTLQLTTDGPNNVKYGLFTRDQLTQLAALRDVGSSISLIHGTDVLPVILLDSGISVEPIVESTNKRSSDLYSGTITMLEVQS